MANPKYAGTFRFENDFAALIPDIPDGEYNDGKLIQARSERGICRVICFSPRHDLTIPLMNTADLRGVIDAWRDEFSCLGGNKDISYVQIFENKGALMGCSNPHPHGQVWANQTIPDLPAKENASQKDHKEKTGSCLLCDYLALELSRGDRVVAENDSFALLVPFWAVWPFEVMVLPKRHTSSILDLEEKELNDFCGILKETTIRLDNLFEISFPYSMGIHQRPTDGGDYDFWHFHLHFFPPLLRSATVQKFFVGYELLAAPQRDITAEMSARQLRELPADHYRELSEV